ncbi:MAG TPA: CoA transferase [Solirubrobacteraceae bacterium]|nr:CoA transferase [Solirubrobacteraceae bacterium]
MEAALPRLRVLDFSRVLAGPYATMMLADLGAQVTKVERPGFGDDTRHWGPPYDEAGNATYFQSVNRNKQSLVLDLSERADLERARRLALEADVLVENFRPGLMDDLGLGYEQLRHDNPRLIYCSITGFGAGAAHLPGYDLLVQALGGLMSITGPADGPPHKVGVALVDVLAGLYATIGILTAVIHRGDAGAGQRVEINLLSSLLAAMVNQSAAYTAAGVVPTRMGNRHPSIAPYEALACADGELVVAVGNDRQFGSLCAVVGAPELAEDRRFATNTNRVANRESLIEELEGRLAGRPAAQWAAELTQARVPAGTVNDIASAFRLAQSLGLEPVVSLPRADGTEIRLPRNPIGLSATPPSYRTAPPELGSSLPDQEPLARSGDPR